MKKLLVLMIILGLSTVANATLSGNSVTDGIVTWGIKNDQLVGHGDSLGVYPDGGPAPYINGVSADILTPDASCTKATGVNNEAGDLGTVTGPGFYFDYVCMADDANTEALPNQVADADWFQFDIAYTAVTTIEIWTSSDGWSAPVGTITVIPEPITIALLGLGGLLLRRRK